MNGLDYRVRRGGQETVNLMRPWHRLRLRAAITVEVSFGLQKLDADTGSDLNAD
jgi:hypothetical protein